MERPAARDTGETYDMSHDVDNVTVIPAPIHSIFPPFGLIF